MFDNETQKRHQIIRQAVGQAVAEAIERHRRLGQAIAVWQDGKVVVVQADEIPPLQLDTQANEGF